METAAERFVELQRERRVTAEAEAFRARRLALKRSVREVADAAGLEMWKVYRFELGRLQLRADRLQWLWAALLTLTALERRVYVRKWVDVEEPLTAGERRGFERSFTRWNARGLRRLNVHRFEVAVNEVLRDPRLYARIDPRATVEVVIDEED